MSQTVRLFYAHAKGMVDKDIDARAKALKELAQTSFPGSTIEVVTGRDDYNTRAKAEGGWSGWTYSVGCGCDHEGQPRFNAVICDSMSVGKATADIMRYARGAGKKVAYWDGNDQFAAISGIEDKGQDRWRDGWAILFES
jgi:hypothetical protein